MNLGFMPVYGQPDRYLYKGWKGRYVESSGAFYFLGFSYPIFTVADLQFMLINYQLEASFNPYPGDLNLN